MALDIVDLQEFYATALGQQCRRRIHSMIKSVWPDLDQLSLLGMGYPIPYLDVYRHKAERVCVMMNAPQGIVHWPSEEKNLTALIDYDAIPLADQSFDRILVVHSLEHAHLPHAYLRELWRILKDNGRIFVITPNRRSIWAQLDDSPFGHGNPYTMSQLSKVLREFQFTPLQSVRGLYIFPTYHRSLHSSFPIFDWIGPLLFTKFSGLVGIEAIKQVYGGVYFKEKKPLMASLIRARTT